jgi:hypothetical protein
MNRSDARPLWFAAAAVACLAAVAIAVVLLMPDEPEAIEPTDSGMTEQQQRALLQEIGYLK